MTDPGRATSPRPNRRETARGERGRKNVRTQSKVQLVLGTLIFLAVAASIVMVFSDSVPLLRIGLVAALWAAVIGAIAMTKYRKDSENDAAKTRDLKLVYELQLEREIAARREYELVVETQVRRQVEEQVRIESTEELIGLREEMAALRSSLEALFDGELPDERTAVRAESHRLQELAGAPGRLIAAQAADLPPIEDVGVGQDEDEEGFEPDYEGYRQAAQTVVPGIADADDDPQTAETQILSEEELVEQDFAAQGYAVQGFTVQSFAMEGFTTDGVTTESFSAEGYSAEGYGMPGLPADDQAEELAAAPEEDYADAYEAEGVEDDGGPATQVFAPHEFAAEGFAVEEFEQEFEAEDEHAEAADELEDADEPDDADLADEDETDEDDENEHSVRAGGRSVADLMARLQANGTLPESGGRRRRRAEE